jgi:FAD binding domain-containing protein/D-arabinono-1,4-lactone oxidase
VSVAFQKRKRWRNHTGNQSVEPLRIYRPATLAELREIVRTAEADGATVRAVGSGHSWSDVALTTGYLVRTDRLGDPLEVDCRRSGWEGGTLVRVEAGMRIRALNQHLAQQGLALTQMGGYDAQTVAGVVSTSTHGSGIELGPLCDFVQSLDLVAAGGRVHRIERTDGPTDAAAFARTHADWQLHKDDDVFAAAAVNMGCMGVIYAATLAVEDAYWLTEVRELSTWSQVRGRIPAALAGNRHYELYLNLYPGDDGEHRCLVCRRNRTHDPGRRRPTDRLRRHWWIELASRSKLIPFLGNVVLDLIPDSAPRRTDQLLGALADNEYSGPSYKVLNIGAANLLPAYSSEIAVPLADDAYLRAVDVLIDVAARHRRLGSIYHTGLVALRFVRASPAYLSMMHGRDTMMIELIQATQTEGGYELLGAYEDALYALGGRPHWGQVNTLTGSHDTLRRMYPEYDRWLAVHDELNGSGAFDSPFAKRVGISRR